MNIVHHKDYVNGTTTVSPNPNTNGHVLDASSIVSLILWFIMILYTSFSSASKGEKLVQMGNGSQEKTSLDDGGRKSYFLLFYKIEMIQLINLFR